MASTASKIPERPSLDVLASEEAMAAGALSFETVAGDAVFWLRTTVSGAAGILLMSNDER